MSGRYNTFKKGDVINGLKLISDPYFVDRRNEYGALVECVFCNREPFEATFADIKKKRIEGCGCQLYKHSSKSGKSFYDWCVENNRQDLLDRWDYDLNNCAPKDVSYAASKKKYYFKCDKHSWHNSKSILLSSITSGGNRIRCEQCESIAQWILDNYDMEYLEKIWNYELNHKSPWNISAKSHCDIFLNCDKIDYHIGYKTTPARFTGGQKMCGFCSGLQVHPFDSFAAYNINKYGDDFLVKYWDYDKNTVDPWKISVKSGQSILLRCSDVDYHESYIVKAVDFSDGRSACPYCAHQKIHPLDSVASKYQKILDIWSERNATSPYEYSSGSGKKTWFKCENCAHEDYYRSIREVVDSVFRCPKCGRLNRESALQEKTRNYIETMYNYPIYHEQDCSIIAINPNTGYKMPYDNEIVLSNGEHLIIEVNGPQHYYITEYTKRSARAEGKTPEQVLKEQQIRDNIKRDYVLSIGHYHFLELRFSVFKGTKYKTLIDKKIQEILTT